MFIGIEEEDGTQGEKKKKIARSVFKIRKTKKEVIYNFMGQELQIQNARWRIEFQRIHPIRKAKGKKSRPISAKFLLRLRRSPI